MPIPEEILENIPNKLYRYLSLSSFQVRNYRYFPTSLMNRCGPEQWERLRILQACERLEIPVKRWPKFQFPELPRDLAVKMFIPNRPEKFDLPPFNPLVETIPEWRKKCHAAFDKTLDEYGMKFETQFQDALKLGIYTKIPQPRATTELNLRYEWAAQRICYNVPYSELAQRGYTADTIKQAVLQILRTAGWKKGK